MGPNRQSLSHKSPGGTTGPRHLRIGIQGKTHAKQKEIGNFANRRIFPIFAVSFYHRIAQQRYFDHPAGIRSGGVLFIHRTKTTNPMPVPGFLCNNMILRTRKRRFSGPHNNAHPARMNDVCNVGIVHGSSYRKFGVVFSPPQDSANSTAISSFSGSFGTTICAILPKQSNKW